MQHILLLHGAIGAKDQLEPLADELKDNYIVHTLNFSGHGGEAFSHEDFSIPVFAADVLNYLVKHPIDNANIFGYSMGGYVAMYLAKHYPNNTGKIVTLATKFYWDEVVAAKEVNMLDADTILQKVPAFADQLSKRHSPNDWKTVLAKTKDMLVQLGKQNTLHTEEYKTISSPCLLLLGEKDKMVSGEETIAVQKAIPGGLFKTLSETPHPIEQVDMKLLASLIKEFIN
jgi:esterase/lipase